MHDQADDLRELVQDCAAWHAPAPDQRPGLLVVTSGKGGAGTTTIAVNLAVAMARSGLRTILVDADSDSGDVATLCGLKQRYTLADVFSGRRTMVEVLQPGPGSIRVLPGVWGLERLSDFAPVAAERLLGQLEGMGRKTDLVVIDAGNRPHRMMRRLRQAADLILAVTTPETPAILGTYATIKTLRETEPAGPIHSLVNLASSEKVAEEVHGRLAQACRRFLGISLPTAGSVPPDLEVAAAATTGEPFVIAAPGCHATRHVRRLAQTLAVSVAHAKTAA